jgi:hypothetical protein
MSEGMHLSPPVWPAAIAMALATPAAGDERAEAAVRALFAAPPKAEAFAPAFLADVPLEDVRALLDGIAQAVGAVREVTVEDGRLRLVTDTHKMSGRVALDAEGRIATLFLEPAQRLGLSLETVTADLAALGAEVAWLVTREGEVLSSNGSDRALDVGSAFKLGALAVLLRDVAAGRRDWADVVRLEERHRSLPSGRLQDWPAGAPVTLHTAATLMISESDNTATDLLMDVAGRARVDEALGLTDVPSTREVFARWAAGGTLPGDRPLPPPLPKGEDLSHPPGFATYPVPLDTLCRLMDEVAPLDLMAVGPGPVLEGDWARVAFKGGSLPGVLNLTAGVTDGAGRVHCVALTVNDPAGVDAARTTQAFRELLAAVGGV